MTLTPSKRKTILEHEVMTHEHNGNTATFFEELENETNQANQDLLIALKAVSPGSDSNQDPRCPATEAINGIFQGDQNRLIALTASLWHPDLEESQVATPTPNTEELLSMMQTSPLTPEIIREVAICLALLARRKPETIISLPIHDTAKPGPYMIHMDGCSGHGDSTTKTISTLLERNRLTFGGKYAEVGCGPGNITSRLQQKGILPAGSEVTLVDPNEEWLTHGGLLIHGATLCHGNAETIEGVEDHTLDTVVTALTLQWFIDPGETIKRIAKWMTPNGTLFFVGEHPTNATANTVTGLHRGLDIGFSNGAFSYEQICGLLSQAGFHLQPHATTVSMSMPPLRAKFLESLSNSNKALAQLLWQYSRHTMVGTAWILE
ncbi:MAG: class I SAM-dependent methyltransferase [Candidatus Gracilibacteria bacterium]|jgi:SAM-dependent methyltransferase